MKVGLAYPAFYGSFKTFFPELEVISKTSKMDYDLIIFPGGEDINPNIYGCNNKGSYFTNDRDSIERGIFLTAYDKNIKVLGTCRGHQLINAVLGGSLIQDLYTEGVGHGGSHGFDYKANQSWIPERVNSMHHQGVTRIGSGMSILATYKGIVEATANKSVITVQWHPEFMDDNNFFNYIKNWVDKKIILDLSRSLNYKEYLSYNDKIFRKKNEDDEGIFTATTPISGNTNRGTAQFQYSTTNGEVVRIAHNEPVTEVASTVSSLDRLQNAVNDGSISLTSYREAVARWEEANGITPTDLPAVWRV